MTSSSKRTRALLYFIVCLSLVNDGALQKKQRMLDLLEQILIKGEDGTVEFVLQEVCHKFAEVHIVKPDGSSARHFVCHYCTFAIGTLMRKLTLQNVLRFEETDLPESPLSFEAKSKLSPLSRSKGSVCSFSTYKFISLASLPYHKNNRYRCLNTPRKTVGCC
jgi:hypothetical protein